MGPWVYAAAAAGLIVAVAVVARARGRRRAQLELDLLAARQDVLALSQRLDALTAEVANAQRPAQEQAARPEKATLVITGLVAEADPVGTGATPREAEIVRAIEDSRPVWLPAKPLRETLVRTVALAHGLRRALAADSRDRIRLEIQAEVRRSRRLRRAEVKALKQYLRDRRRRAA